MTVAVAEAAAPRAAAARTGGRTSQGRGPAPMPQERGRIQGGASQPGRLRTARPAPRPPRQPRPAAGPQRNKQQARRRQDIGRQVRKAVPTTPANRGNYQTAVLAEFIAAVVLVAATPFAKKDTAGLSPYVATDLMQLMAITIVYFILALVSGVSKDGGRIAAWLGGLILLTVGLGEAARLAKLLNVFGLTSPPGGESTNPEVPA